MVEIINYIKSGEFTFCSRCGEICHLGDKDFMCRSCMGSFCSRGKMSELEKKEKQLYIQTERDISYILVEYRKELAELRCQYNASY